MIARRMAQRVVDRLEEIQIQMHQPEGRAPPASACVSAMSIARRLRRPVSVSVSACSSAAVCAPFQPHGSARAVLPSPPSSPRPGTAVPSQGRSARNRHRSALGRAPPRSPDAEGQVDQHTPAVASGNASPRNPVARARARRAMCSRCPDSASSSRIAHAIGAAHVEQRRRTPAHRPVAPGKLPQRRSAAGDAAVGRQRNMHRHQPRQRGGIRSCTPTVGAVSSILNPPRRQIESPPRRQTVCSSRWIDTISPRSRCRHDPAAPARRNRRPSRAEGPRSHDPPREPALAAQHEAIAADIASANVRGRSRSGSASRARPGRSSSE